MAKRKNIGKNFMQMIFVFVMIAIYLSIPVFAHSGRTDAQGGHHDYKNVSGLGSYHYHHGHPAHLHPDGVCPYKVDLSSKGEAGELECGTAEDAYKRHIWRPFYNGGWKRKEKKDLQIT